MSSIGETLRGERLRQGLEIQQVSETTKIGSRMLRAIEADDFAKLPGGVFTRNFIRQYAMALKLDPVPLENIFKQLQPDSEEMASLSAKPEEILPGKLAYSFSPGGESRSVLVSAAWVLLALAGCGGVYYLINRPSAPTAPPTEPAVQ